eukprot:15365643-Ditylum_brightwellii.AAC.1
MVVTTDMCREYLLEVLALFQKSSTCSDPLFVPLVSDPVGRTIYFRCCSYESLALQSMEGNIRFTDGKEEIHSCSVGAVYMSATMNHEAHFDVRYEAPLLSCSIGASNIPSTMNNTVKQADILLPCSAALIDILHKC